MMYFTNAVTVLLQTSNDVLEVIKCGVYGPGAWEFFQKCQDYVLLRDYGPSSEMRGISPSDCGPSMTNFGVERSECSSTSI